MRDRNGRRCLTRFGKMKRRIDVCPSMFRRAEPIGGIEEPALRQSLVNFAQLKFFGFGGPIDRIGVNRVHEVNNVRLGDIESVHGGDWGAGRACREQC